MSKFVHNLRRPFEIIRANLRPYLVINAIVYGMVIAGLVAALIFPELRTAQVANMEDDGSADLARSLVTNPVLFAVVILGINVITVGLLVIVLPSLIIPFAGIAFFAYRAFIIGNALVPSSDVMAVGMIPHSLTALIEFQAYALVAFGAYLLARSWLRPQTSRAVNRRQGYVRGLKLLGWVSLPALALFVIGAIWESYSLLYLVHPLSQWLL